MSTSWIWLGSVVLALSAATLGQERRPSTAPSSQAAGKTYTAWPYDAKEAVRRQDETAKALGVPTELVLEVGENVTMKLVLIPPGKFVMGSPETEPARLPFEGPQHPVTLTKAYYLGTTEVTQAQYEAVMGKNPSSFKGSNNPSWTMCRGTMR